MIYEISIRKGNIDDDILNNLQKFLTLEEFDTESVWMDISRDNNGQNGNIARVINDKNCIAAISKFMANSLGMLYVCCFLYMFFNDLCFVKILRRH